MMIIVDVGLDVRMPGRPDDRISKSGLKRHLVNCVTEKRKSFSSSTTVAVVVAFT